MLLSPFRPFCLELHTVHEERLTLQINICHPYPPICFGRCSVDTDIQKTAPLQMYYAMAAVNCWLHMFEGGKICAV